MMKLQTILEDLKNSNIEFDNWQIPSLSQLRLEYKVEHEFKSRDDFKSEKDFLYAVKTGKIKKITPNFDMRIRGRSHTRDFKELLNLIKGYKSYPEFRNEKTLKKLYNRFKENLPIDLPIILEQGNSYEIFSGNTRLDVAFQLGITPKALIIKSTAL